MSANVESMFYTREKPWHGLGTRVAEAPTSAEALKLAGLDWRVEQKDIFTGFNEVIPGYKANIRDKDGAVLGIVSENRYKVVQNEEAFSFIDNLLGEGVRFETAGSLYGGKKVWMLARLPQRYIISNEEINPFLVLTNNHDGSGAIKVCITPIRVVCSNTLNLALENAKRSFSIVHTGNIEKKVIEAHRTLFLAEEYMTNLGAEFERLRGIKLSDDKVIEFINTLIPCDEANSEQQNRNVKRLRDDIAYRYFTAPDLKMLEKSAYRFVNAVSDFATHAAPLRMTKQYKESLFDRTIQGNPLIDKAHQLVLTA